MIGWRRPISRRVWPNSTRPNQATCIGSRQAIAWMSKTLFEAPRRARLQSRRGGREWEPASASPSTLTLRAVGQNTNLGIILLCAPLAAAAEGEDAALRRALARVLDDLDRADAQDVFAAIAAANPGGLGHAPQHDVSTSPTVTLREAMAEAAGRDRIARQYVTAYEDVFLLGLPALETARQRHGEARWSTLAVYLAFLAAMPDTHIARKFDAATAEAVRREAVDWRDALAAAPDPAGVADGLLGWDGELKSRGINPGTSADLTVATLFASSLAALRGDKCVAAILPLRANDD